MLLSKLMTNNNPISINFEKRTANEKDIGSVCSL